MAGRYTVCLSLSLSSLSLWCCIRIWHALNHLFHYVSCLGTVCRAFRRLVMGFGGMALETPSTETPRLVREGHIDLESILQQGSVEVVLGTF